MSAASARLYAATNQRAAFGDVTLVLPDAWPDNCADGGRPEVTLTGSYPTSDLRLSVPHPVYGSEPWTQQPGLCGQPGSFVQMAAGYLTDDDGNVSDKGPCCVCRHWSRSLKAVICMVVSIVANSFNYPRAILFFAIFLQP